MRRKGWLIAALLVIALLFVGWFYTNQESVATLPVTPSVTPVAPAPPTPPVTPVIPPVAPIVSPVPAPAIPPNFIVSDNLWQNASRLANADGVEGRGGVQFVVPVGTKLHAPVDRWHVHVGSMVLKGVSFSAITLSKSPDWNFEVHTQSVWFMSRWIEVTNFNPRKGEVFAEVKDAVPFPPANADGKSTLVVAVDSVWAQKSDRSIEDPRSYLWAVIQASPR